MSFLMASAEPGSKSWDLLWLDSSTGVAGNWLRNYCWGGRKGRRIMMWHPDSQRLSVFVATQTTQQLLMFTLNIQTLFSWFKRDIVSYLFIAFNFFLALCNIPQRYLNYISFSTNFFSYSIPQKTAGIFLPFPPLFFLPPPLFVRSHV